MSRDIKFRAWIKEQKRMAKVFNVTWMKDEEHPRVFETNENRNYPVNGQCVLMQFTGLQDKNGVDIYEGDVYLIRYPERLQQTHTGDNIPLGSYTEPLEPSIGEIKGEIRCINGCFCLVGEDDDIEDMYSVNPLIYQTVKYNLEEAKQNFQGGWAEYDNPRSKGGWKWDDEHDGDLQYLLEEYNLNTEQELLNYLGFEVIGNIHQNPELLK